MENEKEKPTIHEKEESKENEMVSDIIEEVTKINGERVLKRFIRQGFLGKGGFAQCYMTYSKETNKRVATKIIPKTMLESPRTKLRLANEIKLHKSLHHQNIVEFYSNFEDEKNVYINLQLCLNGSINDLLQCRYELTTPEIQSFLYGLCQGVNYLHSRNIIHRDIKLGNLFLDAQNKVKIGDFGLASKLQFPHERKRTVCGTPNYIAPQILFGKGYHFEVDVWAIGIILFSLYFAIPPFETDQAITTYQKIKKCEFSFPPIHRAPLQAVDLIKKILILDPHERLTIDQILNHSFMKLGNGIPSSLPNIIIKRAPSKKQLSLIPKIERKVISVEKKNTEPFGMILQRKSSQKNLQIDMSKMEATQLNSVGEKMVIHQNIFAVCFEQVEENLYFFCLNNGNFGLIDSKRCQVYTKNLKEESRSQQNRRLRRGSVNEKQKSDYLMREIPYEQCPYKPLFALKQKELRRSNLKINENVSRNIDISRISQHKELTMIKFANKILQLFFPQKDGFLFDSISRRLSYCHNFGESEKIFQIDIDQLQFSLQQKKQNSNRKSSLMDMILKAGKIKKEKSVLTWKKLSYAAKIFEQGLVRPVKKA